MPTGGVVTPIPAGVVARASGALRYVLTGDASNWFGPLTPLQPMAPPDVEGRQWDYPTGWNIQQNNKLADSGVSFSDLRNLADNYDLLRLVIETRKDQLAKLPWTIRKKMPRSASKKQASAANDAISDKLEAFFQAPDRVNGFASWMRIILEDMFVLDQPCLYVRRTKGGDLFALEPVDGATINPILGADGRTPLEGVAYQQRLKGVPAVNYSRDELIVHPRNPRAHKAFGLSQTEQIIVTVNIAIRRQVHQLQYYTDGSAPDLLLMAPESWNPDQIKKYQEYFDGLLSGNTAQRRRARWIPGGVKPFDLKEAALKDEYDEWLARVVCYCFSVPPTPFVKQMNRATAESAHQQAIQEGLVPLQLWFKSLMDRIISQVIGEPNYEFVWIDDRDNDPLVQAQTDQIYIQSGVLLPDEVRADMGRDPLPEKPEPDSVPQPPGDGPVPPIEPEPPAAKLAKRAIKPIDRKRPAMTRAVKKLAPKIAKLFRAQAASLANQIAAKLGKADEISQDQVDAILAGLDTGGWGALSDAMQSQLEAMVKDGGIEALIQIGIDPTEAANIAIVNQVNNQAVDFAKSQAADLVKGVDATTIERLRGDIAEAIEGGLSTAELADALEASYAFSPQRAEMIARTELARADVGGNMIAYRASGRVSKKEWVLGSEHGIDDECNENEDQGEIPLDEQFSSGDDAPPAHPGCVLGGTVVSAAGVSHHFKRWFKGQVIRLVIEGGHEVTVTPNHPILTMRGWVAASELHQGDEVIKCEAPGALVAAIDPDDHHIETAIEQVSDALLMTGGMAAAPMPSAAEDFHGDGTIDENVYIVWANGVLGNAMPSGAADQIHKLDLKPGLIGDALRSGERVLDPHGLRLAVASDSVVGGLSASPSFGGTSADRLNMAGNALAANSNSGAAQDISDCEAVTPVSSCDFRRGLATSVSGDDARDLGIIEPSSNSLGLPAAADGDPLFSQQANDDLLGGTNLLGELGCRFPGQVAAAKIVEIFGEDFSGHVYNLSTKDGWFIANSIITHNCECDVLPVLNEESDDEEQA
jgi:hypothetical protein